MDINRKAHPECVHASNPYHECASACLERIARGHGGKKLSKNQDSKITRSSFGKKKESELPSPIASRPYQNGSNDKKYAKSPKDRRRPIVPPPSPGPTFMTKKKSSSSSSSSSEDLAYSHDDSFSHNHKQLSHTVLLAPNDVVDGNEHRTTKPGKLENGEKNTAVGDDRNFNFPSPPRSHDNDEENSDLDDEKIRIFGDEIERESLRSDSGVSVGKYGVKSDASAILRSIIDKHGDIAEKCKLESASMRARYLECLCSLVRELRSTPVDKLTKVKVKEMVAVLKDLESVNIDVAWLRSVLEEFSQFQDADAEKERHEAAMESTRQELEEQEAGLALMQSRVQETRARLAELETELNDIGLIIEKFKGKSFIDDLL